MLKVCVEARGIEEHIAFEELKAVRCAIHAFLFELKGRRLLSSGRNAWIAQRTAFSSLKVMCSCRFGIP